MHKKLSLTVFAFALLGMAADTKVSDTYHRDHRSNFQKLHFAANLHTQTSGLADEARALHYLETNHNIFGLTMGLDNLELTRVQDSLIGTHYTFQQMLMGYKVDGGTIVVSLDHDNGRVYMVHNNTYPVATAKKMSAVVSLDENQVYDIAWRDMRVHGEMISRPEIDLVFQPQGASFRLTYRTTLGVEAPFGYWSHTIDARTGEILDVRSASLTRSPVQADFHRYEGMIHDRAASFARYEAREQARVKHHKFLAVADGTGVVFDPDPVTTLGDDTLEDNSPASAFTGAYFTRTLQDIDLSGGTYSLTGPWAQIINFESPNTAPSTTTDGNWTATRGDNSFNDAMTYYHVDINQRYIQSLGFTGATGIQEGSIECDADGYNGTDNSHYFPSSNRMGFGHGCVDDNEDAFVILHEYGHAIHHDINSNWSGGDTGAMGEGFGDYWGGSYAYSTPNGSFHPEWAFPWDGHNNCWGGRVMDNTGLYNPTKSYGAHTSVDGVNGDELWSSPLFQSLVRLMAMGEAREDVDQIILQAHFGIASGPTMREMATAIVATANSLFPTGPHAGIFTEEFELRNILANTNPVPTTDVFSSRAGKKEKNHNINVAGGTIDLDLSWGTGNLDLRLYDPSNNLVASATTSSNPETISYDASSAPGTYRIGVTRVGNGKSIDYTLTADYLKAP